MTKFMQGGERIRGWKAKGCALSVHVKKPGHRRMKPSRAKSGPAVDLRSLQPFYGMFPLRSYPPVEGPGRMAASPLSRPLNQAIGCKQCLGPSSCSGLRVALLGSASAVGLTAIQATVLI